MKLPFFKKKESDFNYDLYVENTNIESEKKELSKDDKRNIIVSITLILVLVFGVGGYFLYQNNLLSGIGLPKNVQNVDSNDPTDMNEEPRKSEDDTPKKNTKPENNGNKNTNSNIPNPNKNETPNPNNTPKKEENEVPKEDNKSNTEVEVPKENPKGTEQQEVPQNNQNQGQSNTPKPTPTPEEPKNTPSTPETIKKPTPEPENNSTNKEPNSESGNGQTSPKPSIDTDSQEKNNTTGLIATCDERFIAVSRNIKEIHFIKLSEKAIKARYNAARYRDIWQWEGKGDIKDWVEGTRLYIASPKKIYFIDSSVALQNLNGFGNEGYGISFGGEDDYVNNNDCRIFHNLEKINFANVDTSQLKHFGPMFYGARNLKEIQNLTNFNTSNAQDFNSMFENCENLQTLDLSSFDTSKVTDMTDMFSGAKNLKTIYVSNKWNTNALKNDANMFKNTRSLVGGAGTKCISTLQNKSVARIDVTGNPGCFTLK